MGSCTRMSSSTLLTNALILLVYCVLYLSSNIGFINAAPARHLLNDQPSVDKPSVIIIGAGMSGIMAAKSLAKHGVEDFIILEATEKIGGRMRKTDFAGVSVELGANWVEGVAGKEVNPIWRLAKEFNLRTFYSDYDNITSNFYSQDAGRPRWKPGIHKSLGKHSKKKEQFTALQVICAWEGSIKVKLWSHKGYGMLWQWGIRLKSRGERLKAKGIRPRRNLGLRPKKRPRNSYTKGPTKEHRFFCTILIICSW
eukprot:c24437_g1_i2 orf=485-1246(-)